MELTIALNLKTALKPELTWLNQKLETLAKESDGFLGDLLHYVLIGSGKRVRPALVFLTSRLGRSEPNQVRVVEEGVELIHIATLIHDDVIDKAALRRGQKTVANEFGVDTAVLLGDQIYSSAFEKVAKLQNSRILECLARSTSLMCLGEIEQLKRRFQFDLSEEEYFSFIRKKTAALFGASARSGAILAGLDESLQIALESYAINLGIAFQIKDDLLDLMGDESIVGKTLHTDFRNGKMTLPLIHFRDHLATTYRKKDLTESLKNPNGQLSQLINRMKDAGSIAYAETSADGYIHQALSQLKILPPSEIYDLLRNLAEMLHDRKS